jgi:hypothetical protein
LVCKKKKHNTITKQNKGTAKVWKKKQQEEENKSMLVQTAFLEKNGCLGHTTNGPQFVNGVTRKMVSCKDGVS